MMRLTSLAAATFALSLPMITAYAQNPSPMDIRACTAIETDSQRLACYDHATGRDNLPAAQKKNEAATAPSKALTGMVFGHEPAQTAQAIPAPEQASPVKSLSLLDSRWELVPESKLGTFNLRGYKPITVMPVFATSNQNSKPSSPNPINTVTTPQ